MAEQIRRMKQNFIRLNYLKNSDQETTLLAYTELNLETESTYLWFGDLLKISGRTSKCLSFEDRKSVV